VREAAPPLAPISRLLDCGTSAATRGDPAHGPTVPTEHIDHGSVSRGRRRDGQYGQKWAVPRTARARTTAAPRTTRLVALTLRQGRRHLWQAKQATLHLRHNDRVKKEAPRRSISYPFPLPLSLPCYRDQKRGYSERDPSPRRKRAPSPLLIRGSKAGPSEGFDSRLRALGPQALLLFRGCRLAPEGIDSRLRARRARDDSGYIRYMAEARATLPRYPRTFPRPAGAIL
jgi:hypothetical protein